MFYHLTRPGLLFLLIYIETWLTCTGQPYCDSVPPDVNIFVHDHIEPIEISSGGEVVLIYFNITVANLTWRVNKIEFERTSAPGPILYCNKILTSIIHPFLLINCDTSPISSSITINYEFNSSLNLISHFDCLASHGSYEQKLIQVPNSNRLIDPHITNLPPYIFYNYTTIFDLVYLVKHPNHNIQLKSIFTKCDQLHSTLNRTRFACTYFSKNKVQALALDVMINDKNYKQMSCNVFPAPVLNGVVGSSFGGANNPIFIIGNHFNAIFEKHIYLKTNLTSRSKCILANSTCIRCFFGLGLKSVNAMTQVSFTVFFNELTEFTNQSLSLTLNPNPIVTSISYSFTENLLYTYFIHFNPHYKPFTNFRIFDPNREDYMSCKILPEYHYYLVCRPWAKLSEKGFNRVHVIINISLWTISYRNVVRFEDGLDYQLIQIYLVMIVSVFVVLALITYVCLQLAKPRPSKIRRRKIASKTLGSILSYYIRKRKEKLKSQYNKEPSKVNKHKHPEHLLNPTNPKIKKKVEPEKAGKHKKRRKSESQGKEKRRK